MLFNKVIQVDTLWGKMGLLVKTNLTLLINDDNVTRKD